MTEIYQQMNLAFMIVAVVGSLLSLLSLALKYRELNQSPTNHVQNLAHPIRKLYLSDVEEKPYTDEFTPDDDTFLDDDDCLEMLLDYFDEEREAADPEIYETQLDQAYEALLQEAPPQAAMIRYDKSQEL